MIAHPRGHRILSMHRSMAYVPDRVPTRHDPGAPPLVSKLVWDQVKVGKNVQGKKAAVYKPSSSPWSVLTKTDDHEDVDSDELELDSIALASTSFAIKPSDLKLPKMGLRDQTDGYQMIKPKDMYAWEQLQSKFDIPEDVKPSTAQRNAELYRMFPDIN